MGMCVHVHVCAVRWESQVLPGHNTRLSLHEIISGINLRSNFGSYSNQLRLENACECVCMCMCGRMVVCLSEFPSHECWVIQVLPKLNRSEVGGVRSFMVLPETGKSCSVFVSCVRAKLCARYLGYRGLAPDPCPAPAAAALAPASAPALLAVSH